jgi:hypothetical protein
MIGLALTAQTGDPAAIQQALSSQFRLTRTTADRTDIVKAGDIVEIQRPGLVMYSVVSPMPPSNTYKNGRIGQGWGGFGKDLMIGMATPGGGTADDYPHRTFVIGEKCWVTNVQVQPDGVLFQLYSDPYEMGRFYANLKIPYPNKKVTPPVDDVIRLVSEVLTVAQQDGLQPAPAPEAYSAPAGPPSIAGEFAAPSGSRLQLNPDSSFTKFVGAGQGHGHYFVNGDELTLAYASSGLSQHFRIQGGNLLDMKTNQLWARTGGAPAPLAPMQQIAPPPPPADAPPPPADAPPPTIAVGQTKDQVAAAFGQPLRAAKIGAKDIFYYKDMKVTFINGKVSNVE